MAKIACAKCGSEDNRISDSRPSPLFDTPAIRRRRICCCGFRWSTYELETDALEKLLNAGKMATIAVQSISRICAQTNGQSLDGEKS